MLILIVLSGDTHISSQGRFAHILNTITLLLWSTRQRIMQHAILVVSLAMTWPLNVLILTAVLSSTRKDGNAFSHYGNWIAFGGFFSSFLGYDYWLLQDRGLLSLFLFTHM
jgi:hypothetical protein